MKFKKRLIIIGLVCALAILGAMVSCGEDMPLTFMDEVNEAKAVKTRYKKDTAHIHDIVAKYVPVGTRKEDALEFCETNEFKIYHVRDKRQLGLKLDESVVCSKRSPKWYLIGEEEVRVILDIKNGAVVDARGYIFLHVL